jgi:hypothetical protein
MSWEITICSLAYLALLGWIIYLMFKNNDSGVDYEKQYKNRFDYYPGPEDWDEE